MVSSRHVLIVYYCLDIVVYEGEYEQEALALNALRVLRGEEKQKIYTGKPVWNGFEE